MKHPLPYLLPLFLTLLSACSEKLDVYAPEKEMYAVFGVLNADKAEQYVRVGHVFQYEGDPQLVLDAQGTAADGLILTLRGAGRTYPATEVNTVSQTGAPMRLYRFETANDDSLREGETYELEVIRPGDPALRITAETRIPGEPVMFTPGAVFFDIQNRIYGYPSVEFMQDYPVYFRKNGGLGFEVRIYTELVLNGSLQTVRWGPTPVFMSPQGCEAWGNESCYTLPRRSLPNFLRTYTDAAGGHVDYDDSPRVSPWLDSLPRSCRVEVTGIDSALTYYLFGSNPFGFGTNLLMDKPDFSNISGENTGVFGSINPYAHYVMLGACTQYAAGIIRTPFPPQGCD